MEVPSIYIESDEGVASKYTDPIDLSNACRAFYQSRLETSRRLKERWREREVEGDTGRRNATKKSSIDIAIETLRKEIALLMEQDLCLMKQLLTLNEEIEELKWRRVYAPRRLSSSLGSELMESISSCSLGRVDEEDLSKFAPRSSLSLQLDIHSSHLSVITDRDLTGSLNRLRGPSRTIEIICERSPAPDGSPAPSVDSGNASLVTPRERVDAPPIIIAQGP